MRYIDAIEPSTGPVRLARGRTGVLLTMLRDETAYLDTPYRL
jgi:hypothetical protein